MEKDSYIGRIASLSPGLLRHVRSARYKMLLLQDADDINSRCSRCCLLCLQAVTTQPVSTHTLYWCFSFSAWHVTSCMWCCQRSCGEVKILSYSSAIAEKPWVTASSHNKSLDLRFPKRWPSSAYATYFLHIHYNFSSINFLLGSMK